MDALLWRGRSPDNHIQMAVLTVVAERSRDGAVTHYHPLPHGFVQNLLGPPGESHSVHGTLSRRDAPADENDCQVIAIDVPLSGEGEDRFSW